MITPEEIGYGVGHLIGIMVKYSVKYWYISIPLIIISLLLIYRIGEYYEW